MRAAIRIATGLGLGLVIVSGCSGGASPSGGGSSAAPSSAASSAASSAPSAAPASGAPASAAPSAPAGGGGGTTTGVCALVTTDELAQVFGVPVTTQVLTGPPDTCDIQSDGAPIAAFVLMPTNGAPVYEAYASDPSAQEITGIGDKAAFSPTAQLLVVLKGDSMLSIAVFDDGRPVEQRLELMKKLATSAVGRM